jgi:hypothetical protein
MPVIVIVGGLVSMALTKLMTKDVTDIGKTEEKE